MMVHAPNLIACIIQAHVDMDIYICIYVYYSHKYYIITQTIYMCTHTHTIHTREHRHRHTHTHTHYNICTRDRGARLVYLAVSMRGAPLRLCKAHTLMCSENGSIKALLGAHAHASHVSSYCCVIILLYVCPHTTV